MKLKIFTSALVIVSLLLLAFGAMPVSASGEEPREFSSLGKGTAEFALDEIVVKFKQDPQPFRVIKIPEGKIKEKIAEYSHRPNVVYAEPNYYAQAILSPGDPMYSYQWNFGEPVNGGIGMEQSWDISTGAGVIVAIVDTGIAYENYSTYAIAPDLDNTTFVQGYDFVNNDTHPNDDNSHGTHVAGTVAQSTNNGIGVAGVAFDASLMPVKVLNKKGSGTYTNIADGIYYAADNGAKVINLSLGGSYPSQTLEDALAYAYNMGVTIVAAAGNDGTGTISYPAAYDAYVIAVGATRYDTSLAYYSNYGASLDLVAPGGDLNVDQNGDGYGDGILQNTFNPTSKRTTDFGYWFFQGTSMASPHVAGVAALLIENGNATTPSEIKSALQETAQDLGVDGWDSTFGWGLVDAYTALNWASEPNSAPIADSQSVDTPEDISLAITLTATDSDPNDTLTYTIVNEPTCGVLSGTTPNVTYTPNPDYYGSDSFFFKANDGRTDSNIAKVEIDVTPVNDAPVAQDQSVSTTKGILVNITLTATDPEGDTLMYTIVTSPSSGSLSGTVPNVTYTPNQGFIGADSFTFRVNDGTVDSDTATVSITVTEVPTTPTVTVSISMSKDSRVAGKNIFWWAIATVDVGVEGATVEGHWEGATTDTDSGITNFSGEVSLQSDRVKNPTSPIIFTFEVDRVTKGDIIYKLPDDRSGSITIPIE